MSGSGQATIPHPTPLIELDLPSKGKYKIKEITIKKPKKPKFHKWSICG